MERRPTSEHGLRTIARLDQGACGGPAGTAGASLANLRASVAGRGQWGGHPRPPTPPEVATPADRFVVGSGAMLHRFGADSTVASGRLRLVARGAALHRNVDFLQRDPTILPRRHSGASRKMTMAVVGVVWLGTVALWLLKEFDNHD